jgi:lipopolysaccharide biosynthesis glycosyltransferase
MEYKVFICTNTKQELGALLAKYTIERYSSNLDKFSVEIIYEKDFPAMNRLDGEVYLRKGKPTVFFKDDLQSWTLIRFSPPQLMEYKGRALVIDPDIFSVGSDVWELLNSDLQGAAIGCCKHGSHWGSSVMLLDNTQLSHWHLERIVAQLLDRNLDYRDQMSLSSEENLIYELDSKWNSFDQINADTCLLHTTMRMTQPWRTGLPVNMVVNEMKPVLKVIPRRWVHRLLGRPRTDVHLEHPDPRIRQYFFEHVNSALKAGVISVEFLQEQIEKKHIRKDMFTVLEQYDVA